MIKIKCIVMIMSLSIYKRLNKDTSKLKNMYKHSHRNEIKIDQKNEPY